MVRQLTTVLTLTCLCLGIVGYTTQRQSLCKLGDTEIILPMKTSELESLGYIQEYGVNGEYG